MEAVGKGLQSVGKIKAEFSVVVTAVLGVVAVIVAVGAFVSGAPVIGGLALLFAVLMYAVHWWSKQVEKNPTLQMISGGDTVASAVADVFRQ
jgi:hypothetical protein